jgi:hypothetical protein
LAVRHAAGDPSPSARTRLGARSAAEERANDTTARIAARRRVIDASDLLVVVFIVNPAFLLTIVGSVRLGSGRT